MIMIPETETNKKRLRARFWPLLNLAHRYKFLLLVLLTSSISGIRTELFWQKSRRSSVEEEGVEYVIEIDSEKYVAAASC